MKRCSLWLIMVGLILFAANWLVFPDGMDPILYFTSEYVNGGMGWLTTAAFILVGLGIVVGASKRREPARSRLGKAVDVPLLVYGSLFGLLAVFPADHRGHRTDIGRIHVFVAGICFLYFLAYRSIAEVRMGRRGRLFSASRALLMLSFAGFVGLMLNVGGTPGIWQRLYIFSQVVSVLLMVLNGDGSSELPQTKEERPQT